MAATVRWQLRKFLENVDRVIRSLCEAWNSIFFYLHIFCVLALYGLTRVWLPTFVIHVRFERFERGNSRYTVAIFNFFYHHTIVLYKNEKVASSQNQNTRIQAFLLFSIAWLCSVKWINICVYHRSFSDIFQFFVITNILHSKLTMQSTKFFTKYTLI